MDYCVKKIEQKNKYRLSKSEKQIAEALGLEGEEKIGIVICPTPELTDSAGRHPDHIEKMDKFVFGTSRYSSDKEAAEAYRILLGKRTVKINYDSIPDDTKNKIPKKLKDMTFVATKENLEILEDALFCHT